MEVYGKAALGGAFNVSRAAHLHIFFCKNKSVCGGAHEFQAFAALTAEFVAAHEYAVGFVGASANSSAELV